MNLTLSYPNSFKSQKKIAEEIAEFVSIFFRI